VSGLAAPSIAAAFYSDLLISIDEPDDNAALIGKARRFSD